MKFFFVIMSVLLVSAPMCAMESQQEFTKEVIIEISDFTPKGKYLPVELASKNNFKKNCCLCLRQCSKNTEKDIQKCCQDQEMAICLWSGCIVGVNCLACVISSASIAISLASISMMIYMYA